MNSNFHRNMRKVPTDQKQIVDLIKWVKHHKVWTYEDPEDDEENKFPYGGFDECAEINFMFVDPETGFLSDDEEKNTKFIVTIESGDYYDLSSDQHFPKPRDGWNRWNRWTPSHNIYFDVFGFTLQEALLNLAVIVEYHCGDEREYIEGISHENCKSDLDHDYKSVCIAEDDGFCKNCGFYVEKD